jgi:hypothetical protein
MGTNLEFEGQEKVPTAHAKLKVESNLFSRIDQYKT